MELHRLYLDTNVYVEAIELKSSAARLVLDAGSAGDIVVVASGFTHSITQRLSG